MPLVIISENVQILDLKSNQRVWHAYMLSTRIVELGDKFSRIWLTRTSSHSKFKILMIDELQIINNKPIFHEYMVLDGLNFFACTII